MKNTIKAKHEYIVKHAAGKIEGSEFRLLYDGDEFVMAAYVMSREDHFANIEGNECYHVCEVFTTRTGKQFIYARDEELDEDYLIKLGK